jgi:Ca2+-binding RTX toxin-like protein
MATTLNFLTGVISNTEGFDWTTIALSALNDGTFVEEATGSSSTITMLAPDGSKFILTGTFTISSVSPFAATGAMTGFEVWKDSTQVMTAAIDHEILVEDVLADASEDATLEDLIAALQVIYGGEQVTSTGSPQGERIFGGSAVDVLGGADGGDWFTGFEGNDTFNGGDGWDDVRYGHEGGTMGVVVNLSSSQVSVGELILGAFRARDSYGDIDRLNGINFVSGTAHDDAFVGRNEAVGEFDFPDFVSGAAGRDAFMGGNGPLGVAYDQPDIESGGGKVKVNLSTTAKYGLDAGTARDTFGDIDILVNIRNVSLSQKNDTIFGGSASERFWGRDGGDLMFGNKGRDQFEGDAGNDSIDGGEGKDTISGGLGRDQLKGGQDADHFVYFDVAESKSGATQRDFITDFQRGIDDIHVRAIDANTTKDGNQAFKFDARGTKNTDVEKGHIGWYYVNKAGTANDRTILKFNVDNDDAIEMSIELKGLIDLSKGDFIL